MNQVAAIAITTASPQAAGAGAQAPNAPASGGVFANVLAQLLSSVANQNAAAAANVAVLPQGEKSATAATPAAAEAPAASVDAAMAAQLAALQLALQTVQTQTSPKPATPSPQRTAQQPAPAANGTAQPALRGTLSPAPEFAKPASPAQTLASQTPSAVKQETKAEKAATSAVAVDAAALAALAPAQNKQTIAPAPTAAAAKPTAAPKRAGQTTPADTAISPSSNSPAHAKSTEAASNNPVAPVETQSQGSNTQTSANKPDGNAGQPVAQAPTPALPAAISAQHFDAAVAAAPQTAVPLDALAVHIARKFESGSNEFEISLHPAELGKLNISLSVADDGQVQASIRAERPETLDLLQRDSRNLEQQLRQAGLDVGSNALSFSLSNGNNGRPAPFTGWPSFAGGSDDAAPAKDDLATKYVAVRIRDGVDIQV